MELLEQGDTDRAIVEFRNVFKLNGLHREARIEFANLQRERGNIRGAMGEFLRLVEQYPNDLSGRKALAEMSFETGNWEDLATHVTVALEIDSADTILQALKIASDYQQAVSADDPVLLSQLVDEAGALRQAVPESLALRQVIVDDLVRKSDFRGALAEVDAAIALEPDNRGFYQLRLSLLGTLGDVDALEAQLIELVALFPEDPAAKTTLVRWYMSQQDLDSAEAFLRASVVADTDEPVNRLTLIRFLAELRGPEVAIAEIDQIIADGDSSPVIGALRAGLMFETGDRETAIADMQGILAPLEASQDQRNIKLGLAQMLIATNNAVGARALVEEVLADDATNVEALKLKANWLIDNDKVGEAIVALRTALDQSPKDADIMSIMARAYERDGNQELVGEMLSLAVGASNQAPEESIRYARYLSGREKFLTAEEILIDALRIAPNNVAILTELGNVYISLEDWSRAEQVAATLGRLEVDGAKSAGNSLTAILLQRQEKPDEAIRFLEELIAQGQAGLGAHLSIIRSYLQAEDTAAAKRYIDSLLLGEPENRGLKFVAAAVEAAVGNVAEAETIYRELLAEDPNRQQVWVALFRLLTAQKEGERAEAALAEAMTALPNDLTLRWIQAGVLERRGELDAAIEIYQGMYEVDSNNLIIANNLASLLSTVSEDTATVDRAYTIARRLRGSEVPPYQDTYGWIAFLRGENDVALEALKPAAAALTNDPLVQYHLARAYLIAGQEAEALAQFVRVADLTGAGDTREFVEQSRAEIARLQGVGSAGAEK